MGSLLGRTTDVSIVAMRISARLIAVSLVVLTLAASLKAAEPEWTTSNVELTSKAGKEEQKITAVLYRPKSGSSLPAAVIINSSGGVTAHTEHYYARAFANRGMAALVVDSFIPRGVRRTGDDQSRVFQFWSNADAVAGYRLLAAQNFVDASRIVVIGMSRGGASAIANALEQFREGILASRDIRFAAHVAIAPGSCNIQAKDARTTGAPIFFMLAELDDGTPSVDCVHYAERMKQAGNKNIRVAMYPGVYHAYEWTGGIALVPKDETARNCKLTYVQDGLSRTYRKSTNERVGREGLLRECVEFGYTVGGEPRVKEQATADLLQFLHDANVLIDEEARRLIPSCAAYPSDILKRNCERARRGWVGDMVAIGRHHKNQKSAEEQKAAYSILTLAANRGHVHALFELGQMMRNRKENLQKAAELVEKAADADYPPAMSLYGVMLSEGSGVRKDDAEAVRWFQKGALLRHTWAITNLGRMKWHGRGGLPQDRSAAVADWNSALAMSDNPLAQLYLAEAYELGYGVSKDLTKATSLYRDASTSEEASDDIKRQAQSALSRLKVAPK